MTATPEIQKKTPAWSPSKLTWDNLLKNFRATLEARWSEFDKATMEEAESQTVMWLGARAGRDAHPDFIKAKEAFDAAKTMLTKVNNDSELKENTEILAQVESTLKSLTDHLKALKPDEKWKKMNIILARTTADLASFKADITGKAEDKKEAEVASAAEKAIPRAAVAATVGGSILMWSAHAGTLTEWLSSAVGEWAKDLAKEAEAIKKNPMKKIAEFLGFTEWSITSDFKQALSEKKEGWFRGFFAELKLWFYGLMAKFTGVDIAKSLTPEEAKLAGFKPKVEWSKPGESREGAKDEAEKFLSAKSYDVTTKLLIYGVSRQKFDTALWAALVSIKDATWWLEDIKKKEEIMSQAIVILAMENMKKRSWSETVKLWEKWLLEYVGWATPKNKAAVNLIFTMMGHQSKRLEKVFSPTDWKSLPLWSLMSTLYEREWHGKIEELVDWLKNIDVSKVRDIPTNVFIGIKDAKFEWLLTPEFESLKSQWVSWTFLMKIIDLGPWKGSPIEFWKFIKDETLSAQERAFIDKVLDTQKFLNPLKASLKERFGLTDTLLASLTEDKIQMKDLLEIYLMIGWETDLSKLNKGRKALLYTKLQMMFIISNPNDLGVYLKKLLDEGAEKYPDAFEVGTMVDSVLNYGVYKATFKSIEGWEKVLVWLLGLLWVNIESRAVLALGWIGALGGLIWLAIKLSPVWRVATIVSLLAWALGIAWFTAAQATGKK